MLAARQFVLITQPAMPVGNTEGAAKALESPPSSQPPAPPPLDIQSDRHTTQSTQKIEEERGRAARDDDE